VRLRRIAQQHPLDADDMGDLIANRPPGALGGQVPLRRTERLGEFDRGSYGLLEGRHVPRHVVVEWLLGPDRAIRESPSSSRPDIAEAGGR
jgi:hypothetical protein